VPLLHLESAGKERQVKVKLSLCLTKYVIKMDPVLDEVPQHEDIMEEWRYSTIH
jgi:hypothetical protein